MSLRFLLESRKPAAILLFHAAGLACILVAAFWLRGRSLQPDPVLQGYLQIMTGLLAFVLRPSASSDFRVRKTASR